MFEPSERYKLNWTFTVFAGFLGLLACTSAWALEVQRAEAMFADEEYRFEMTALLDASIQAIEPVLRDYEGYRALDARILEARVIEHDPARHIATLETVLRACVGPICRKVKRIERVEESPGALVATTDPARSDMKFGETRMKLESTEDGRTRVIYHTRLKPAFWIPALVARRIMLETLEDATIDLFRNVEKRAQELASTPKS
jgi:hypothetical protein